MRNLTDEEIKKFVKILKENPEFEKQLQMAAAAIHEHFYPNKKYDETKVMEKLFSKIYLREENDGDLKNDKKCKCSDCEN